VTTRSTVVLATAIAAVVLPQVPVGGHTAAVSAARPVLPAVSLTSPRPSAVAGVVVVSATASHPAGITKVVFLANNRRIGEDTTAPYSVPWATRAWPDGRYRVQALAISRVHTATYTPAAPVVLANAAPRVTLTAPRAGSAAGVVSVSATASHAAGITKVIFLANRRRIGEDTTAPYSVPWDTRSWQIGSYGVQAVAISRVDTAAYTRPTAVSLATRPVPVRPPESRAQRQTRLELSWTAPANGVSGPRSVWRQDIRRAPLAANSPTQVGSLARQVRDNWGGVAAFNVWNYTTTVATVGPGQRRARVTFDDCQHKGYTPGGLYGKNGQFEDVPIPDTAMAASGGDSEVTVYSPSTDQLWEFWVAHRRPDGWHACWGGRMDHVSTGPGYFSGGFGATATGLPNVNGMVSFADVRRGSVNHALSLQVIDAATWYQISYPAQRGDGQGSGPIREGTRFRLDPRVDVASLGLNRYAAMVARAAQTYGFIVTDKGGAVAVLGEGGDALVANGGTNPWHGLLGRTANYSVLAGFPWDRLQALPTDWGKPAR